jgi:hypothetical protein
MRYDFLFCRFCTSDLAYRYILAQITSQDIKSLEAPQH